MNIILSSWPGTGSTTLGVLLSHIMGYQYLYAGSIFRYLGQRMIGSSDGLTFARFEQDFGDDFDAIWENYAKWKLKNSDKLLLEAKTAGFFNEGENIYEIMLIATKDERLRRATRDGRQQAEQTLLTRDQQLRDRWTRKFGLNIFDINEIQNHYDLILDTTSMSLNEELGKVLQYLEEDYRFPHSDLSHLEKDIDHNVNLYWEKGKSYFVRLLDEENLLIRPEEVFEEWKEYFREELQGNKLAVLL